MRRGGRLKFARLVGQLAQPGERKVRFLPRYLNGSPQISFAGITLPSIFEEMNVKRTNMLLASGLAAVVVGLASANSFATTPIRAVASSDATVRSITVSFGELDLTKPAGAEALYRRIKKAARAVCDSYDSPTPWNLKAQKQCSKTAIDDAVAQVNAPLLSPCIGIRTPASRE
jgi:UrcA family protein